MSKYHIVIEKVGSVTDRFQIVLLRRRGKAIVYEATLAKADDENAILEMYDSLLDAFQRSERSVTHE